MFTYCYVLAQIKNLKLPFGVMFFGKADQVVDQDDIARFGGDMQANSAVSMFSSGHLSTLGRFKIPGEA